MPALTVFLFQPLCENDHRPSLNRFLFSPAAFQFWMSWAEVIAVWKKKRIRKRDPGQFFDPTAGVRAVIMPHQSVTFTKMVLTGEIQFLKCIWINWVTCAQAIEGRKTASTLVKARNVLARGAEVKDSFSPQLHVFSFGRCFLVSQWTISHKILQ